ncbi:hypothetical protein LMG7974_00721 [Campylobacter majalis]|uniref:Twin-arginine translocation signal domain-containing protein n=1 Tax=Campylobacter majalis TaxID=2790656 RepID=A0ABN7K5P3_9BACT|nr:twin-arginine translocation signal domain-containing protein [Campylobacter majalis]CAD7287833.1 hypothetical protein LMG7974_00721 [Campylobacter majalis]
MQTTNRRQFLKKLMVGGAVSAVVATSAVAHDKGKKAQKNKDVLYERTKTWEFYYKQAN